MSDSTDSGIEEVFKNTFDSVNGKVILAELERYINLHTYKDDINVLLVNEGRRDILRRINSLMNRAKE